MTQLNNNIIVNGMPEQPWEPYEVTKERITEVIASSMGSDDDRRIKEKAKKVEITCCSRLGTYKLGKPRPISVTFKHKEDKERLMTAKKNLPPGIYVNHEYPAHIKRAQDKLQPILRLAKSLPQYRDKSRLENDKLIINGIGYTLNEIGKLPPDLAAYKAAEKTDTETIIFHGELSPWSNFHHAPFTINNQRFVTSEHWI